MIRCIFIILTFIISIGHASAQAQDCSAKYIEQSGLLVAEIESEDPGSGWVFRDDIQGFSGLGFFEWQGGDNFNSPGQGILRYQIKITNPGTYRFHWHCKVGKGNNNTEHNDSWLRFPDAADNYGLRESDSDTVRAHGNCSTDCPNGGGRDGWYKIYSSGTNQWTWSSRTSDHDPHNIRARFDTAGIYAVEISGRSKNHMLDRFVLFHEDSLTYNQAIDMAQPESICPDYPFPEYSLQFRISANKSFQENLRVELGDSVKYTDADGRVGFSNLKRGTKLELKVFLEDFFEHRESITVLSDINKTIFLEPLTYAVNFEVKEGETPLFRALVEMNNSKRLTDRDGMARFASLPGLTTYSYTVSYSGYAEQNGSLDLEREDHTEIIDMVYTSLGEKTLPESFFYPNPASSFILIQPHTHLESLMIYSLEGKLINVFQPEGSHVDISELKSGQYIMVGKTPTGKVRSLLKKAD